MTYVMANKRNLFSNSDFVHTVSYSLFFSTISLFITMKMIPIFMELNHKKKIFGVDINKCADIKDLSDPNRKEV